MLATALFALMAVTQTDQTVPVQRGVRLDVGNFAGEVAVKTWDKDAVRVVMATEHHTIIGSVYLRPGERLKDEMNAGEQFIAVTDAEVCDPSGARVLYSTKFMTVNTTHIAWIMPSDELAQPISPEPSHDTR